jgi:hypothetical protein
LFMICSNTVISGMQAKKWSPPFPLERSCLRSRVPVP